jgi:hypothetical protein
MEMERSSAANRVAISGIAHHTTLAGCEQGCAAVKDTSHKRTCTAQVVVVVAFTNCCDERRNVKICQHFL